MDQNNVLYYGDGEKDAVMAWNTSLPFDTTKILYSDSTAVQWADTFAFDKQSKSLLYVTNRLFRFFQGTLSKTDANFRIISSEINSESYILSGDPQPPTMPCLNEK